MYMCACRYLFQNSVPQHIKRWQPAAECQHSRSASLFPSSLLLALSLAQSIGQPPYFTPSLLFITLTLPLFFLLSPPFFLPLTPFLIAVLIFFFALLEPQYHKHINCSLPIDTYTYSIFLTLLSYSALFLFLNRRCLDWKEWQIKIIQVMHLTLAPALVSIEPSLWRYAHQSPEKNRKCSPWTDLWGKDLQFITF